MKTDREFLDGIYEKARILEEERTEIDDVSLSNEKNLQAKKSCKDTDKITDIENLLQLPLPKRHAIPIRGIVATAAAFAVVIAGGSLFINKSVPMEIPQGYTEISQISAYDGNAKTGSADSAESEASDTNDASAKLRSAPAAAPMLAMAYDSPVVQAEVICTAKVGKIEKSIYDEENRSFTTTVQLQPIEIIKGQEISVISITVGGGYDKKNKTCQEYEEVFMINESVLLFLEKAEVMIEDASTDSYILLEAAGGKYTPEESGESFYQNAVGAGYRVEEIKAEVAALSNSVENPVVDLTK